MGKFTVEISEQATSQKETIVTDGCVILYWSDNNIRITGKIDPKLLTPLLPSLLRFAVEKFTK